MSDSHMEFIIVFPLLSCMIEIYHIKKFFSRTTKAKVLKLMRIYGAGIIIYSTKLYYDNKRSLE